MRRRGRRSRTGRRCLAAASALAGCALIAGCRAAPLAPPDAAARIAGRNVPYSDFEHYLERSVGLETVLPSEVLSGLLDEFVDELLLLEVAREQGIDTSATGWEVAEALVEGRTAPISKEEVGAYYSDHLEEFVRPERVRLRQVLGAERSEVEEIARRLRQGAEFDLLMSEKASAVSGREDELSRDDIPAAFADVIFALEPGELSEVVSVDYGFHLFQVLERLPEERVDLARAASEISNRLRRGQADRALRELVAEARGRYNVEVYERNLPFNYRGLYATEKDSTAGR